MVDKRALLEKAFPFWGSISEEDRTELLQGTFEKKFCKGESIKSQNSACLGAMYVISGRIRGYITSEEGKEVTLYYVSDGDVCVLTANCVIPPISFEIQIEAVEDTILLQVAPTSFGKVQSHNLIVENFALKIIAERFSDVIWSLEQFHSFSIPKRIAMFLYDEMNRTKSNVLTLTHEEIAKALGSAREVISRKIKDYEEDGIVELGRGKITITDVKALKKLI
jgi:CRP/FNR family transcriptional regulator, anaerobic regulatory protein